MISHLKAVLKENEELKQQLPDLKSINVEFKNMLPRLSDKCKPDNIPNSNGSFCQSAKQWLEIKYEEQQQEGNLDPIQFLKEAMEDDTDLFSTTVAKQGISQHKSTVFLFFTRNKYKYITEELGNSKKRMDFAVRDQNTSTSLFQETYNKKHKKFENDEAFNEAINRGEKDCDAYLQQHSYITLSIQDIKKIWGFSKYKSTVKKYNKDAYKNHSKLNKLITAIPKQIKLCQKVKEAENNLDEIKLFNVFCSFCCGLPMLAMSLAVTVDDHYDHPSPIEWMFDKEALATKELNDIQCKLNNSSVTMTDVHNLINTLNTYKRALDDGSLFHLATFSEPLKGKVNAEKQSLISQQKTDDNLKNGYRNVSVYSASL